MKNRIDNLSEIPSHFTRKPNKRRQLTKITHQLGWYTTTAKNIRVYDRDTDQWHKLPNAIGMSEQRIMDSNYLVPAELAEKTLASVLYEAKQKFECTWGNNWNRFMVEWELVLKS